MKHVLYILTAAIFFLTSCEEENEVVSIQETGYFCLSEVEAQSASVTQVSTRTVSEDLAIEIISAGTTLLQFDAGDAQASEKIELDAGTYTLKAYSTNCETEYTGNEKGEPKYYVEQEFTIEANKVNYLTVDVPMTNFGVLLTLPDGFDTWFSSYTFTVQMGDRSVTLTDGDTVYFDLSDDDQLLYYSLYATNTDSETNTDTGSISSVESGHIYEITYSLATRSVVLK